MYFTLEDYQKISNWLKQHAVKDTEFKEAHTPQSLEEYEDFLVIGVQFGNNVKLTADKFLHIFKKYVDDADEMLNQQIISVRNYAESLLAIIRLVESDSKTRDEELDKKLQDFKEECYSKYCSINDESINTIHTWSSFKISSEISKETSSVLEESKSYTDTAISQVDSIKIKVVQSLPTTGEPKTLYLTPTEKSEESNVYDEYLYVDDKWEKVGSTAIDVSQLGVLENDLKIANPNVVISDALKNKTWTAGTKIEQVLKDLLRKVNEVVYPTTSSTIPTKSLSATDSDTIEVGATKTFTFKPGTFTDGTIYYQKITNGESTDQELNKKAGCTEKANTAKLEVKENNVWVEVANNETSETLTAGTSTVYTKYYRCYCDYTAGTEHSNDSYGQLYPINDIAEGTTNKSTTGTRKSLSGNYYCWIGDIKGLGSASKEKTLPSGTKIYIPNGKTFDAEWVVSGTTNHINTSHYSETTKYLPLPSEGNVANMTTEEPASGTLYQTYRELIINDTFPAQDNSTLKVTIK